MGKKSAIGRLACVLCGAGVFGCDRPADPGPAAKIAATAVAPAVPSPPPAPPPPPRIKRGGISTTSGVMLFKEADGPKQATECFRKYQVGNPEAEQEALAFATPKEETIAQLRGLCLIATNEVTVSEGTRIDILDRAGPVLKVKLLDGDQKGSVLYAMSDAVSP